MAMANNWVSPVISATRRVAAGDLQLGFLSLGKPFPLSYKNYSSSEDEPSKYSSSNNWEDHESYSVCRVL